MSSIFCGHPRAAGKNIFRTLLSAPFRRRAGAAMFAALVAQGAHGTAAAAPPGGSINFTAKVPLVTSALPLFKLTPAAPPLPFVKAALARAKLPPLRPRPPPCLQCPPIYVSRDDAALHAYVDPAAGNAEIFGDITRYTGPVTVDPLVVAKTVFGRSDVIPKDATLARLGGATPVFGSGLARPDASGAPDTEAPPQQRLTYVPALRFAAGYPVIGPGSHAFVAVGNDGSISGFVRRWKTASLSGSVAPTATAESVIAAITSALKGYAATNTVTVNFISRAYYDGDAKFLQPAYFYTAVLRPTSRSRGTDRISGFVPVGKLVEGIPAIGTGAYAASTGPSPTVPRGSALAQGLRTNGGTNAVSLGEYANRDGAMLGMANELNNGLSSFSGWFGPPIARTQWYWAYPWEVAGPSSGSYLNAVNIAYTQPHGDWYINTTLSNWADLWNVNNIGTGGNPGYGAAAGGKLATWIIDSCEVIPAYYDLQQTTGNGYNAFTPWRPVFNGLHNVLGFRTQMWLSDGLNFPFGFVASLGADVNSAWFQEIAADPNYDTTQPWNSYTDGHFPQTVHMGRASTFIDGRDLGHSIFDVAPQNASGTLWNFWMNG